MEALTPWHLLIILIGFVLLFGHRKLPDAARALGRSLRIFASEMRETGADPRPDDPPTSNAVAELESQASAAEALAAQLRARATAVASEPDVAPAADGQRPPGESTSG